MSHDVLICFDLFGVAFRIPWFFSMFQGQGLSDGLGDTQLPQILCRSWVSCLQFPQISRGFHHHLITATTAAFLISCGLDGLASNVKKKVLCDSYLVLLSDSPPKKKNSE